MEILSREKESGRKKRERVAFMVLLAAVATIIIAILKF